MFRSRRVLAAAAGFAALLAGGGLLAAPSASARVADAGVRMSLPAPTGRYDVGTASVHLIDRSRADPWVSEPSRRELMVSLFYPAQATGRPDATYMLPGAAAHFDAVTANAFLGMNLPTGRIDWADTRTPAYEDAPVDRRAGRLPILLYSPGLGEPRTWSTTLVQQLASRGYLVVTIDNTYESPEVQFPDGRVELIRDPAPTVEWVSKMMATRVADTRFVLDELAAMNSGARHDSALPRGLRGSLNLAAVGMFGHSAGGFATAQSMYDEPRIKAGVNLDGTMTLNPMDDTYDPTYFPTVVHHGLNRPFLLMGSEGGENHRKNGSWAAFWSHSTGWRADVTLRGSRHASFTDAQALVPQIAAKLHLPAQTVTDLVGTIKPARANEVTTAYLTAFFDRWLRQGDGRLLDGPSVRYPEMSFIR